MTATKTQDELNAEWEKELDEISKRMKKAIDDETEAMAKAPKIYGKFGIIDDVTPDRGDDHLKE
jgi:hypothetical protein